MINEDHWTRTDEQARAGVFREMTRMAEGMGGYDMLDEWRLIMSLEWE